MNTNQVDPETVKAELTRRKIATWCGALDSMDEELGALERQLRFATADRDDGEKGYVTKATGYLRAAATLVFVAKGSMRDLLDAMLHKDAEPVPVLTDADRKEAKEASER